MLSMVFIFLESSASFDARTESQLLGLSDMEIYILYLKTGDLELVIGNYNRYYIIIIS